VEPTKFAAVIASGSAQLELALTLAPALAEDRPELPTH